MTSRELECLHFIRDYTALHGVAPSYDEIAEAMHIKSKSGVSRLVSGLKADGLVETINHRARAIRLTDLKSKIDALRVVYGDDAVREAVCR